MRVLIASTLINWGMRLLPAGTPGRAEAALSVVKLSAWQLSQMQVK
jgi:hypothetical protein